MSLGWTWDYCLWSLDIPRIVTFNAYWRTSPPLHLMVAAYLGIKPAPVALVPPANDEQAAALIEMFGVRPMPKIMTAEEYLARRENHG